MTRQKKDAPGQGRAEVTQDRRPTVAGAAFISGNPPPTRRSEQGDMLCYTRCCAFCSAKIAPQQSRRHPRFGYVCRDKCAGRQ